jgi:DNA repair photolyase
MPSGVKGARYNEGMAFAIFRADAKSILSETSGFIAQAGFTHSLTPARNCGFACTYCYVPTMRFQGGLKPEDWRNWGAFTTFKSNADELLPKALRPYQAIYCSPLVDPYQPAEESERMMPRLLEAFIDRPPRALAIQTRGPLILRDLDKLRELAALTRLRVSFSLTTDREDIRRLYEPLCASLADRLHAIAELGAAGISVHATLAPLLPCDPEALLDMALEATAGDIICDPFHSREVKSSGATTREAALRLSERLGFSEWHAPRFQDGIVERLRARAALAGRRLVAGIAGFRLLAEDPL